MKTMVKKLFRMNDLNNKVLVKLWDQEKKKWYFEIVNVKNEEKNAIISYQELLNKTNNFR